MFYSKNRIAGLFMNVKCIVYSAGHIYKSKYATL
nr:MAG TPA: hypothetical protein [Caudoviricetes sp.]